MNGSLFCDRMLYTFITQNPALSEFSIPPNLLLELVGNCLVTSGVRIHCQKGFFLSWCLPVNLFAGDPVLVVRCSFIHSSFLLIALFASLIFVLQPGIQLQDLPAYAFDEDATFGRLFEKMLRQENKIPLALYRQ